MWMRVVTIMAASCCLSGSAFAQQRPLVTEDPETVGAGRMLVEAGIDYTRDAEYPASGLTGHLRRFPVIGISLGIGEIGEVQIDGGFYNHLSITDRRPAPLAHMLTVTGDQTSHVEDMVVGTKIRLVSEGASRPSLGLRSATRLPMASNESGLGLDTMDFYSSLLVAKTVQTVRLVGNIGLGILGDPTRGDRQNDVLTYGLSFARAVSQRGEIVGEINGRKDTRRGDPPPGTESHSMLRVGARYTAGAWRADGALMFGLLSQDPSFGVTAGFTYVFNAFQSP
ncbi:MAG: hypothetical protein A3I61_15110 [Acidobacteria bacterium RIFCSPLOWO2_02_FULL_68_18]|nr:MAG: hypothetical protein A3I61_15110 [Acidobacteria bacterium RIFCSPLOWO2_02_FULL_68_18]OFW49889.1 MAG: hypothetical protein A3G77_10750 [Acidobacteria bacterium RIFCSPLOWO2_12_FULL_68_19]